jgi:predicted nucleic acid-binding protein
MVTNYLGAGEREAIALAVELNASEVLLDDLPARRLASHLGLPVLGTLGILLRAKARGLVPQVRPLLQMLHEQDFRMSEQLFDAIVAAAGERIAPPDA